MQTHARSYQASFPCAQIEFACGSPDFAVIGQIPLSPAAGGDGRQTVVHADKRAVLKIVVTFIAEKFESVGRVPQPFASGLQVLERNDARSQFGNNRYSRPFAREK